MKRLQTTAAVAATSVLGAGAAALAAGRYAAGAALRPSRHTSRRGTLPAGFDGPALTVHALGEDSVTLTRSLTSRLPGRYGLLGHNSHAVVGPLLGEESGSASGDTVVRRLERVEYGELVVGDRVWLTPQVHARSPRHSLGIDCADVEVPGELGSLPAWFMPGARQVWVIAVHGLGATREHATALLPFYAKLHLPVLVPAYRGDPGAPRPSDGVGHLGNTEWRDLDAAIRYAVRYGAEQVVLHGWSTGATMALHAAADSALRDRVAGLVLDSPVLDWQATVRALTTARHTPRALQPLVVRAAQGRAGFGPGRLSRAADPSRLAVPTVLFHGPDDAIAPWEASRELAGIREDLIAFHAVPDAPHAAMWNVDPATYEEAVRRFLTPLL